MIHIFNIKELYFAVDTNSGLVHAVDKIIYDLLMNEKFKDENKYRGLSGEYGEDSVKEALSEIKYLIDNKMLYTEEINYINKIKPVIKAMCLNMTHDCNLSCEYCFASQGTYNGEKAYLSFETGKKAFDYLVKNSGNRRNLEVDFFGGEPLMNFNTIKKLVDYGRSLEKEYNKHFRFTVTTNGVLLDEEKIDYINENMDNVVLSIDGRKETNDRMRKTINGKGSYDLIIDNFKKFINKRGSKDYFIRGTYTSYNLDFSEDVKHMRESGFDKISVEPVTAKPEEKYALKDEHVDILKKEYEKLTEYFIKSNKTKDKKFQFFHFNIDLESGPCIYKRSMGCGAGTEYVAVTPKGELYPCHQFVGQEQFIIGSVDEGITNHAVTDKFKGLSVNDKPACRDCWAKYFCSGGCHANAYNFNNNLGIPYKTGCELEKKRIECSIYIKAKHIQ
ncbi:MAG TPA: thioether cross-link-forming SCIFF peptide maturase [Sedimentibacter sp.]|nr:thioether cross-link-forming SCIFF peptide maturase [Sedimentibacter sp.]HNZ82891.1 thioether cross-link-forming SCIFF peptide maturase [Sedimentibacter sp.]HOH69694.1 thioether cross-link-forming SCIFF peptide maturase [Sedimentibacter sp.]HPW99844.1 thioether cross-link-forming SCIFF peptide maturase [Sedimentibacter sp.]